MSTDSGLKGRVRSGLLWSFLNNVSTRLSGLLISILVARLLVPEEFAIFGVGLAVTIILGTFADFGMSAYLVRSEDFTRRAPTVATLGVLSGCVLALGMYLLSGPIASGFGSPAATPVIQLLSVSMALSGFAVVPGSVMQREFLQSRQLVADSANLVISTVVTVVLVKAGYGAMSLAWSRLVGQVVGTLLQYRFSKTRPVFGLDRDIAHDVLVFGLPLASANFLSWLLLSVDNMVVGRTVGVVALGFYILAFNLSSWPLNAIGQSVRVVALPGFSRQNDESATAVFAPSAAVTWAVALPAGLLLAVLARPLISFLYGERWLPAAAALGGLALFGSMRVLFDLMATLAIARGATRPVLWVQIWWIVVLVPAMYVGVKFADLSGAGWAHLVVAVVAIVPAYLLTLRKCGVRTRPLLVRLAPPLLAAAPATAAAYVAGRHIHIPILALLAGGCVFVACYVPPLWSWARRQLSAMGGHDLDLAALASDVGEVVADAAELVRADPRRHPSSRNSGSTAGAVRAGTLGQPAESTITSHA